jgi:hypothetical protein
MLSMLKAERLLALAATFATGCFQPPAIRMTVIHSPEARWQYACIPAHSPGEGPETFASKANVYGRDGWELAGSDGVVWCFKRPLDGVAPSAVPAH